MQTVYLAMYTYMAYESCLEYVVLITINMYQSISCVSVYILGKIITTFQMTCRTCRYPRRLFRVIVHARDYLT